MLIKADISVEINPNKIGVFSTTVTKVAYPWRPGSNQNPELGSRKGNDMVTSNDNERLADSTQVKEKIPQQRTYSSIAMLLV